MNYVKKHSLLCSALLFLFIFISTSASATNRIQGRVEGGGGPITKADVTLWVTASGAPQKLAQAQTAGDGSFQLTIANKKDFGGVLYLIAEGGVSKAESGSQPNPAIMLMTTLGTEPVERVTINELTTVASVWTAAQFLNGSALSGNALGLRIAAGNVPNLVDIETGGLGPVIVDPMNGPRTTTLAKMNTLGLLLSGCVTENSDACDKLFDAATPPGAKAPINTLQAAQPWLGHRLFGR